MKVDPLVDHVADVLSCACGIKDRAEISGVLQALHDSAVTEAVAVVRTSLPSVLAMQGQSPGVVPVRICPKCHLPYRAFCGPYVENECHCGLGVTAVQQPNPWAGLLEAAKEVESFYGGQCEGTKPVKGCSICQLRAAILACESAPRIDPEALGRAMREAASSPRRFWSLPNHDIGLAALRELEGGK